MNEAFSFTTRGTFYLVLQQIFNTLSLCIKSRPKQNFKMRRMLECNPVINLFSTYYSPFFSYSLKLRFLTFNPKSRPDAWLSFQADFLSKIYYFSKQKNVATDFQHFKILRIQLKYSCLLGPKKYHFGLFRSVLHCTIYIYHFHNISPSSLPRFAYLEDLEQAANLLYFLSDIKSAGILGMYRNRSPFHRGSFSQVACCSRSARLLIEV